MQNLFHCRKITRNALLLASMILTGSVWADSDKDGPIGGKTSDLRLLAARSAAQDYYRAAIEISLKPGALTYWRQPGDAGVPPVFSFDGSANLAKAEVLYPAPTRIKEDEGEAFGYRDKVVFPLHVTPRDKNQPVILKLTADYAVCERICIPAKSRAELVLPLPPGQAQDMAVAAAETSVPRPISKSEAAEKMTLTPQNHAGNPSWQLDWKNPGVATDLFAEAPEGWYFETKKTAVPNQFSIVAIEMPKTDLSSPVPVTLTLTGPQQNFEFTLPLDAPAAAR